jgi:hypothetical protein
VCFAFLQAVEHGSSVFAEPFDRLFRQYLHEENCWGTKIVKKFELVYRIRGVKTKVRDLSIVAAIG